MDIKKIQKGIELYIHRDRSKLYISPYGAWTAILVFVALSFVVAMLWGYYIFTEYYIKGVTIDSQEKTTEEQLSDIEILKHDLDGVLVYFATKEDRHKVLLKEKKTFENVLMENTLSGVEETLQVASGTADVVGADDI